MAGAIEDTEHVKLWFECEGAGETFWNIDSATFSEAIDEPFSLGLRLSAHDESAEPVTLLGQSSCVSR